MHRWSAAAAALAAVAGVGVLALLALLALPAQASSAGIVVRVSPSQGLRPGQTVAVTGHDLPKSSGGSPRTWFVTECTAVVRGQMNPSTDTPHCDIAHAQALRVSPSGAFSSHYRVTTGIIGDGYCGTAGHATCVIGVGTAEGLGTVVRITFATTAAGAATG